MGAYRYILLFLSIGFLIPGLAKSEDTVRWPREYDRDGLSLVIHQPQIDRWNDFNTLEAKAAVSLTLKEGAKPFLAALLLNARTAVDHEAGLVYPHNVMIQGVNFPHLDQKLSEKLSKALTRLMPDELPPIPLDFVLANLERTQNHAETLDYEPNPPDIIITNTSAVMVQIYGSPVLAAVEGTDLVSVINSSRPLFAKAGASEYYLLIDDLWLTSAGLKGPWAPTVSLPESFASIPKTGKWEEAAKKIPAAKGSAQEMPEVHVVTEPSELIEVMGAPELSPIGNLSISYVKNTPNDLFYNDKDQSYYYLVTGRWFKAGDLEGPWTYATDTLPPEFALIPEDHPKAGVLVSVPGTNQARMATLKAQVPRKASVKRLEAAFSATYNGDPIFAPIDGVNLYYAVNTPDDVIQFEDKYYACHNAVWFIADSPLGPWETLDSVPEEIYVIPPHSSKYHVTYVHTYAANEEIVAMGYTAGYEGVYIQDGVIVYGTGYHYPAYVWKAGMYHPVYYPPPYRTYGYAAVYNPNRGRFVAGSTMPGPYGAKFSGGFYNPLTGAWGKRGRYKTPYGAWGDSVVTTGEAWKWISDGQVTGLTSVVDGIEGSMDRRAPGPNGSKHKWGVVKTGQGDLYVGKDGNIYKKTKDRWLKSGGGGKWLRVEAEKTTKDLSSSLETPATGPGLISGLNRDFKARHKAPTRLLRFPPKGQMNRNPNVPGPKSYDHRSTPALNLPEAGPMPR
jgi:hypothetical protein